MSIVDEKEYEEYFRKVSEIGTHCSDTANGVVDEIVDEIIGSLWEDKRYRYIAKLYDMFELGTVGSDLSLFEAAYSYNETGNRDQAEAAYEYYLDAYGENAAALHNLALIYKESGRIEESLRMYDSAVELDPQDKKLKGYWEATKREIEAQKEAQRRETEERDREERFLTTAPERWPTLDRYKRRLLLTLDKIKRFSGFDELGNLCGMDAQWAKGHYKKLVELGMIIEDEDSGWEINPEVQQLLEREKSHSVAISVIRARDDIRFKPIFNSGLEYNIYNIMIGLFPNHLIFPNMGLQSIFDYSRMKTALDPEVFTYYLRASVDLCVVSTANYCPILAYEIDSAYHDTSEQRERDRKKNEVFKTGGVYLLRIRAYGEPSLLEIRGRIIDATRELGTKIDPLERDQGRVINLLREIDFSAFGEEKPER